LRKGEHPAYPKIISQKKIISFPNWVKISTK